MPYQSYAPALADMRRALRVAGHIDAALALPAYSDFSTEMVDAILEEAARFAGEVLSPLNATGDRTGSVLGADGNVQTPAGFAAAYKTFCESGWNAAPVAAAIGGQGLPCAVSALISEMWHGANMAFGLAPMLTQSAIELVSHHGSDTLKSTYLARLISGEWAGTMCMTEPQAGSDVGAVRTRAVKNGDAYRLFGTKIFITYGEHDLTDNIIHMVLARIDGAPAGSKGLSLFLVPKFMVQPDASLGARNDVKCVSLEHKMGINASPTCVMAFGESDGAIGYLIGEENRGLAAMFSMMNPARFAVGLEGIGVAAHACQLAKAYAAERVQTAVAGMGAAAAIAHHPDVKRMLLGIESHSTALRALALHTAGQMDLAMHGEAESVRLAARRRVDLLIPVVKAHGTATAFNVCSETMQVFGGMGYIEEAGVSQLLRDARIAMIYEGTNGIQALDLAQRKLPADNAAAIKTLSGEIWQHAVGLHKHPALGTGAGLLLKACKQLDNATIWMQQTLERAAESNDLRRQVQASATDYLSLLGYVMEAHMLLLLAEDAQKTTADDAAQHALLLMHYFMQHELAHTASLESRIVCDKSWV